MYLFLKRGEERERNTSWLPLTHTQLGTRPTNQACCRNQESSWGPFSLQDDAQPTKLHSQGKKWHFKKLQMHSREEC